MTLVTSADSQVCGPVLVRVNTLLLAATAALLSLVSSLLCLLVVWVLLPFHKSLGHVLMMFDAVWYRHIALFGYSWNPHSNAQQSPNFFPLYPLVERGARLLTGLPISKIAVGSSVAFQAVAAAILALIAVERGSGEREALTWVTLFVVSPPVVFDIMGYYSALFCVLLFMSIYLAQRGKSWLVALALGLASAANPLGIAFAGGFVTWAMIDLVSTRSLTRHSLLRLGGQGLVSVSGVIGYGLYLQVAFGSPLVFYQATKGWSVPVPLGTVVARIITFEPLRASVTDWAASPYGSQVNFLFDALAALAVVALIIALIAVGDAVHNLGFWLLLFAFVLLQALSARWGSEIGALRILLPVAFGAGVVTPVRRMVTRPAMSVVLFVLFVALSTFLLQHLATGQWLD